MTECGQGPRALWELKGSAWSSQRPRGLPGGGGTSTGSYREKRGHEVHGVGFWCSGDCREWTGAPRVPPCLRSAGPSLVSFPRSVGPRAGVGRPLAAPRAQVGQGPGGVVAVLGMGQTHQADLSQFCSNQKKENELLEEENILAYNFDIFVSILTQS